MKKYLLLGTSFFVALLAPLSAYAAGENIGINAAIKGDVTVQTGEQQALQAVLKAPIYLGDQINSQHDSSLQVLLVDETVFTVGPDCELTIDKFVYDPDASANALSANVAKGMFRFMSGNISKSGPESVSINTPVASMGVRGTIVEGLVGREAIEFARRAGILGPNAPADLSGASLFVLRGPGRNSSAKNRKGEITVTAGGVTRTLKRAGMAVFVADKNSPPSEVFFVSDTLFAAFNDRIRTKPKGGPTYRPFELDPFMEFVDPPAVDQREDINYGDENPDTFEDDPTESFDFPGDGFTNCTPADPDYPSCL